MESPSTQLEADAQVPPHCGLVLQTFFTACPGLMALRFLNSRWTAHIGELFIFVPHCECNILQPYLGISRDGIVDTLLIHGASVIGSHNQDPRETKCALWLLNKHVVNTNETVQNPLGQI
jgi:hypothetical protein